jgi:hypothetical protein
MAAEIKRDPDLEWLYHVRPVGLVVAPVLLKELGLAPTRPTQVDSAQVATHIAEDDSRPTLNDPWSFVHDVLGWETGFVAGSPGGPPLPDDLHVSLPQQATTLSPTWAVKELGQSTRPWQLLVRIEPAGVDPDTRDTLGGWEATAHQRFERLLRETGIHVGVLMSEKNERKDGEDRFRPELRLVYAPKSETSGYLSFPLRDLRAVAGRSMLGGLKLLLDAFRLFADASDRRLPALLEQSREAQAAVSTALAEQVLGALHELLRGLDAAVPDLIRELARKSAAHLYEGLLTVLMRLVFVLYAEDRDLLPSRPDGRAQNIYEIGYSVRGLYDRLTNDAALNPDTMDERRGAWGQLLALFRLIHKGHPSHFIQARGGKLFYPEQFPFLEGRAATGEPPSVPPVSDGCILRILEGLMTLAVKGGGRERISYRALDVEQIGSVYETVMGFRAEQAEGPSLAIKAGKNNRTPVFVSLTALLAAKGKDRIKYLKEEADRGQLSAGVTNGVQAARTVAELAAALDAIVDERGSPKKHPIPAGTPILQPTDERRRTGSHYTPRTLTAPIVEYALAPAFVRLGPDATPDQILDLKVCDPAMGSGAFLVEACRALAARLVQAWVRHPEKKPKNIPPDENEELYSKRLVAQRCLYGVDKNPLATDLAKLSLWLATLARDHEFTFLDHALKSGDSLVGLTRAQITATHWDASKPPTFIGKVVSDHLREAEEGRQVIREHAEFEDEKALRGRLRGVEAKTEVARIIGDSVVAAFFADEKLKKRIEKLVAFQKEVQSHLGRNTWFQSVEPFRSSLRHGEYPLTPFHWEIEFPEVFSRENPGFDSIVGNPPFLGGSHISGSHGKSYLAWLLNKDKAHGNADLVAHFFRRAYSLLRSGGTFGLIATNTIAQGDTRETGLYAIISEGASIARARRRLKWPGEAAVVVAVVHVAKGEILSAVLDNRIVPRISAFLVHGSFDASPSILASNADRSFEGSKIYGGGFTFDDEGHAKGETESLARMRELIEKDPRNSDRIFPYLGGDEINNNPRHVHNRFVIDFEDFPLKRDRSLDSWAEASGTQRTAWLRDGIVPADYNGPVAADWPDLLAIVEKRVKPERDKVKREARRKRWWRFGDRQPGLYEKVRVLPNVLGVCRVSPQFGIARLPTRIVYADSCDIFALSNLATLCMLQARPHELWARFFSSSMKDDLRYAPSDCFETFPFPLSFEADPTLEDAGRIYLDHRNGLMVRRNEGMTATNNRFHDAMETSDDVLRLRELHGAMDRAVLEAYGWHDLAGRAAPIVLDETNEDDHTYQGRLFWPSDFRDEVLARLLALNAERHAEEVRRGIAPGMKGEAEDESDEKAEAD